MRTCHCFVLLLFGFSLMVVSCDSSTVSPTADEVNSVVTPLTMPSQIEVIEAT